MINLAKICLIITLFGQLAYNAASYYVNLPHPSYPVWGVLYFTVAMLFARGDGPRSLTRTDLLYAACVAWTTLSFAIAGESDGATFVSLMMQFVIPPYIIGRFIGRYFTLADLRKVYILAAIMLVLVLLERVRHPEVFAGGDRLKVFTTDIHDSLQGGIAFYIASLFGSTVIIAFSLLSLGKEKIRAAGIGRLRWHWLAGSISLIVMLLWGSRGAFLSLAITCLAMFSSRLRVAPVRVIIGLFLAVVVIIAVYNILPPERQAFIDQIPEGLAALGQSSVCIQTDSSVLIHLTYWRESFKLIGQFPFLGVGASNFGHYWCGDRMDFMSPHSDILHAFVELGIAGATVWLAMYWSVIQLYRKSYAALSGKERVMARTLFLVWVFTLLASQMDGSMFQDYQLYTLTGAFVSYITHARAKARAPAHAPLTASATASLPGHPA